MNYVEFLKTFLYNTNDPLKEALKYFENHPSITNIKSKNPECKKGFSKE